MKRILFALCAVFVLLTLASCGASPAVSTEEKTETASATAEPLFTETEETAETEPGAELGESYSYHAVTLDLPEGFTVRETEEAVLIVPSDYPAHTDNITLSFTKNFGNPDSVSDEALKEAYEGSVGALTSFTVARRSMLAHDAIIIEAGFEANGAPLRQKQYLFLVGGNATHVTFTLTENSEYEEIFDSVVSSFSIED